MLILGYLSKYGGIGMNKRCLLNKFIASQLKKKKLTEEINNHK